MKQRVKSDLHPKKILICVWWDWEGTLYWEILERNATVKKKLYIAELYCVNETIQLERPHWQDQTIFLCDNTRPHVEQVVKAALQKLNMEVFQHLPYSPDLTPTDYHLFHSLLNSMRSVTFDIEEDLKNWYKLVKS